MSKVLNKRTSKRPITKAGSSLANKTGLWRNEKPEIDEAKCIGCSLCAKLCPDNCIYMKEAKNGRLIASPDYDYCKGCGICASECPVKAIRMIKE
ncbi:MAG: 4Fe-4S binding protein [Patescibacteria group bacterium]|jgi:2-oxoacid:acceptor oxidoreductase delta subunit (pyruvate/2-ketoisovalerate family)|nr:4Fe-4S binding protein [Patescibacteria group bacterium]